MKKLTVFVAALLMSGCAVKLPGTRDAQIEQVRLLTHAIEKQAEAMVTIATGKPTPDPSPSPTPKEKEEESEYGEETFKLIATSQRIK